MVLETGNKASGHDIDDTPASNGGVPLFLPQRPGDAEGARMVRTCSTGTEEVEPEEARCVRGMEIALVLSVVIWAAIMLLVYGPCDTPADRLISGRGSGVSERCPGP